MSGFERIGSNRVFIYLLFACSVAAQIFDVPSLDQPVELSGMWKRQAGDDPRWAEPGFDDSAWATHPGGPTASRILPAAWFRLRLKLPEGPANAPLGLLVGSIAPAYEIYADGRRIGALGDPGAGAEGQRVIRPMRFALAAPRREFVLAFRVRNESVLTFNSLAARAPAVVWVGTSGDIDGAHAQLRARHLDRILPYLVLGSMVLTGIAFLVLLWSGQRDSTVYLWCAAYDLLSLLNRSFNIVPDWLGFEGAVSLRAFIYAGTALPLIPVWAGFLAILFRSKLTWVTGVLIAVHFAVFLLEPFLGNWTSPLLLSLLYVELGWRSAGPNLPLGKLFRATIGTYVVLGIYLYGRAMPSPDDVAALLPALYLRMAILVVFTFVMGALMLKISSLRLADGVRMKQALEAASHIQSLLLNSRSANHPQLAIEGVSIPASETGGDFHQILDRDDGSTVIITGDVSGKGLKAAMLVAVIIGALRRETSSSPSAILNGLNQALAGHTYGGFVTCCCARIHGKDVTVASAGHPPPYLDGVEFTGESGLPLGISIDATYAESSIAMPAVLTLVSDGVLEAANAPGELFGFDRTREISTRSAREIADAAKAWGQNDDITVVTVRRAA